MSILNRVKNRLLQLLIRSNNIGKNVQIGAGVYMVGSDLQGNIKIGDHAKLHHTSISGEVSIGQYTSLWGPNIHIDCVLNPVRIGNFCSIAKNVTFQEYNHDFNSFTTYFIRQNLFKKDTFKNEIVSKGSIVVEHDVWIGAHCVILGGAHIATGAVIAANSVVNGYIPAYAIAGGSPAKVIKYRFEEKKIEKLLATEWWNWDEDVIKEKYNDLMSIVKNDGD